MMDDYTERRCASDLFKWTLAVTASVLVVILAGLFVFSTINDMAPQRQIGPGRIIANFADNSNGGEIVVETPLGVGSMRTDTRSDWEKPGMPVRVVYFQGRTWRNVHVYTVTDAPEK